jgi:hypothetical protein
MNPPASPERQPFDSLLIIVGTLKQVKSQFPEGNTPAPHAAFRLKEICDSN